MWCGLLKRQPVGTGQNLWETRAGIIDRGANIFLGGKKRGRGLFFAIKKGGKYFFLEKIKGTNIIFHRKKGGHEIFSSHRINILINRIILLLKIEVFVP